MHVPIIFTVVPSRLVTKLNDLGLNTSLWMFDFLTGRPQVVRVGRHSYFTIHFLSFLLYTLYRMP